MARTSRRLVALLAGVAAVGLTTMTTAVTSAASVGAATSTRTYVALGDSYAAGFGLPLPATPTQQPVPGCAQTSLNYPHQLAKALHLDLTDVSCSGAVTDDFFAPQSTSAGTAPAQLDAVKAVQPGLVTITIGGNDLGFSKLIQDCLAVSPTGPLLVHPNYSSCSAYYSSGASDGGLASNPYQRLAATQTKIGHAIVAVRKAAPNAKVLVIGYPAIEPNKANTPAGGCFNAELTPGGAFPSAFPFTDADVPYLQVLQMKLDKAIDAAATRAGATYADIYPSSLAHSACSPESVRWVEPLEPGGGGTNSLHPSIPGEQAMATKVLQSYIYP